MIRIFSDPDGARHYLVPAALRDVARELFPTQDDVGAIFSLARRLMTDHFATTERIALEVGHAEAVSFAREKLVTLHRR